MAQSISFDCAADMYDATRADPPHVANALTETLLLELDKVDADRVLEIGIGTGRIARPLAKRGIRITGFDIAPRMMAKLRDQLAEQHLVPDLQFGDATALPLKDASFQAALGVHILHLVSSLESAVSEIRRVLAPDGVYLSPYQHYSGDNPWAPGWTKWDEIITASGYVPRRRPREAEIVAAITEALGPGRTEVYATHVERWTPREHVQRIRDRVDSWTWSYPDSVFDAALTKLQAWYPAQFPDQDRVYEQTAEYTLTVWHRS